MENSQQMTFPKAIEILGIEEYGERIFHSNSNGELIHLQQYFMLAKVIGKTEWFPLWFNDVVKQAEVKLKRPDVVFQYIAHILVGQLG